MVIEDWRPPIVEMVMVKQNLAAWDPKGIFPNHLPEVAATEESIHVAEQALGVRFDREHRGFLSFADGWKCFHQSITLLGTTELVAGPLRDAALEAFEYAPELLEELGRSTESLLPIAASLEQADVFVMLIDDGSVGPKVLWLAEGELIDTFDSFGQYFISMIEYTNRRITKMQEEAKKAGLVD
ncbi:SMI1/KNR4 family protein [Microbacterium sp. SD291]|uniref:SMI1/KNR4 family protein n=1 Tax=Microbacterium sp. SD291 TaxID=2782007 RepID=UPI001A97B7DA|nr:SMI1/KNR4 family protein [Microbacterium sp. SD291]MBO0981433.1 SMI1/KNR4 family protein [Microbacterium sp. SD291]